jgi:hypothetical protein
MSLASLILLNLEPLAGRHSAAIRISFDPTVGTRFPP